MAWTFAVLHISDSRHNAEFVVQVALLKFSRSRLLAIAALTETFRPETPYAASLIRRGAEMRRSCLYFPPPVGKVGEGCEVCFGIASGLRIVFMEKLDGYLRIKEAAEYLGVSPNTLRNWGRDGKILEHRHPMNNYRLYKKNDLAELLRKTERPRT